MCSSPPHTPFWSWHKRHYWFPSKLVSVPEALKTSNLWRSLLCEVVPPSTTTTWKFSSLLPLSLSISPYSACWTVETHRKWILPRTRSRTWRLRCTLKKIIWSCHKHPLGVKLNSVSSAQTSISQIFSFAISSHFRIQICGGVTR